jgi:hypothetical protein
MWRETNIEGGPVLVNYDHVLFIKQLEDGSSALVYKDGSVIEIRTGYKGLSKALLRLGDIDMWG